MKVKVTLVQYIEFDDDVTEELEKIKTTDDYDELLVTKARTIDTHITEIEAERPKCPKCGKTLRIIETDYNSFLFCKRCKYSAETETEAKEIRNNDGK